MIPLVNRALTYDPQHSVAAIEGREMPDLPIETAYIPGLSTAANLSKMASDPSWGNPKRWSPHISPRGS